MKIAQLRFAATQGKAEAATELLGLIKKRGAHGPPPPARSRVKLRFPPL
jgi:hypothetical protein